MVCDDETIPVDIDAPPQFKAKLTMQNDIVKTVLSNATWIKTAWKLPSIFKNTNKLEAMLNELQTQVDNKNLDKKEFTKIKNAIDAKVSKGFENIRNQIDNDDDRYSNPLLGPLWKLSKFYLYLPKTQSNSYYGILQQVNDLSKKTLSEKEFKDKVQYPHVLEKIKTYEESKKLRFKILKEYQEALLLLEPVAKLLISAEELKNVKPKKDVYQVVPATKADIDKVKSLVKSMAKEIESKLYKTHLNNIEAGLNSYEKKRTLDTQSPFEWAIKNKELYGQIFGKYYKNEKGHFILDSGYKSQLKKDAKELTDNTLNRFIYKNVSKISPIISKKGKLSKSHYGNIRKSRDEIEGELYFEFTDGSSFEVRNAIVQVWNAQGTIFNRFPTTFHDIKMADGKTYNMKSEEWMNTKFVGK